MSSPEELSLSDFLPHVAPGTALRDGIDRVLHAHMGALIVLGDSPEVLEICTGGFHFDAEMTPQRLSEIAKMDGAIVLDRNSARIAWANVHLVPDPSLPTAETGTRHRTAERVARSVGVVAIAVSEEMGTITLFKGEERRQLASADTLMNRANNLLQVLDRFKSRFEEVNVALGASEIDGLTTGRDITMVVQRAEMVMRVSKVIGEMLNELGPRGNLIRLQRDELVSDISNDCRFVIEDYLCDGAGDDVDDALGRLSALSTNEVSSLERVIEAVASSPIDLDATLIARGVRISRRIPHITPDVAEQLVAHFGDLHNVAQAPIDELISATGMDEADAHALKAGMMRSAELGVLDRLRQSIFPG